MFSPLCGERIQQPQRISVKEVEGEKGCHSSPLEEVSLKTLKRGDTRYTLQWRVKKKQLSIVKEKKEG